VPNITIHLPAMYGDHHVTEVRRLLLEMDGVTEVYASSSFQIIEVQFEESQVIQETIESKLAASGYLGELSLPAEAGVAANEKGARPFFRHTAAFAQTGKTIGFTQQVVTTGRPLWPCPGVGVLEGRQQEANDG